MGKKTGPKDNWKMTDDCIRKLEEAFAMDCTVSEACLHSDISADTYYRWIKERPELSERFRQLRNKPFLKARKAIISKLDDPEFALKYMKNKKNDEFSERVKQDVDANVDISTKQAEDELRAALKGVSLPSES